MGNIDRSLINALIKPDKYGRIGKDAPLKGIVRLKIIDYDTEVDVGKNRTVDILVTVRSGSEQLKVAVEVENDRKIDVAKTLRQIMRDRRYPTIAVIPKVLENDAYRFQKKGFYVWYWTATCKWLCQACDKITKSTSSTTPNRCDNPQCQKGANLLRWIDPENINFEEAESNPTTTFAEFKHAHNTAWVFGTDF